jgi:predicted DNA-binding transcriptional regulator YafY
MFKLLRLWNVKVCEENYAPRKIPPERRDFDTHFTHDINDIKLAAVFDPSVKYQLIETYGLDCYTETADGLHFEFGFHNRSFLLNWLLGFGDKVKVLEPRDIIEEIQNIAENIVRQYE